MKYRSHLVQVKTQLGPTQFDVLHSEMYRLGRHTLTAYVLWACFGWAGVHQFYLGKRWKGLGYVTLSVLTVGALGVGFLSPIPVEEPYLSGIRAFGILTGSLLLGLMVIDMFSLHRQVDVCNERIEDQIIMALVDHVQAVTPEARRQPRTQARPLYFE